MKVISVVKRIAPGSPTYSNFIHILYIQYTVDTVLSVRNKTCLTNYYFYFDLLSIDSSEIQ